MQRREPRPGPHRQNRLTPRRCTRHRIPPAPGPPTLAQRPYSPSSSRCASASPDGRLRCPLRRLHVTQTRTGAGTGTLQAVCGWQPLNRTRGTTVVRLSGTMDTLEPSFRHGAAGPHPGQESGAVARPTAMTGLSPISRIPAMCGSFGLARAVRVSVVLVIADHLASGCRTVAQLAEANRSRGRTMSRPSPTRPPRPATFRSRPSRRLHMGKDADAPAVLKALAVVLKTLDVGNQWRGVEMGRYKDVFEVGVAGVTPPTSGAIVLGCSLSVSSSSLLSLSAIEVLVKSLLSRSGNDPPRTVVEFHGLCVSRSLSLLR